LTVIPEGAPSPAGLGRLGAALATGAPRLASREPCGVRLVVAEGFFAWRSLPLGAFFDF
jgi:hypothetical protein